MDVDAEGPEARDLQRLGGEAAGSKLDGGQVEDGEQAGFRGATTEGAQEKGTAAGGRVRPENSQEGMEQTPKGGADGQARTGMSYT